MYLRINDYEDLPKRVILLPMDVIDARCDELRFAYFNQESTTRNDRGGWEKVTYSSTTLKKYSVAIKLMPVFREGEGWRYILTDGNRDETLHNMRVLHRQLLAIICDKCWDRDKIVDLDALQRYLRAAIGENGKAREAWKQICSEGANALVWEIDGMMAIDDISL